MGEAAAQTSAEGGFRAGLRGWGALGILAFLLVAAGVALTPPIGAVLVLLWAWASRTPWRELGFVRPKSWLAGLAIGLALGVGLKFLMKAIVLPLVGAEPVNQAYHYVAGNAPAALELAAYAIIGAGFAEEVVFRGYLFERFGKLFGMGAIGSALTVAIVTVIFGIIHYQQGVFGVVNATIVGFLFCVIYLLNRRRLWTVMVAHAAFDLTATAIIYLDLESAVAHSVFK